MVPVYILFPDKATVGVVISSVGFSVEEGKMIFYVSLSISNKLHKYLHPVAIVIQHTHLSHQITIHFFHAIQDLVPMSSVPFQV